MKGRRNVWSLVAAAGLLAAMTTGGNASAGKAAAGDSGSDKSMLLHYRCDSLVNFLPADSETVREVGDIPPELELKDEHTGTTVLFFWQLLCEYVTGDVRGTAGASGLTVNLESPPADCPDCGGGGYGPNGYDIWQLVDDPRSHALYTRAGLYAPLVRGMSVSFDHLGGQPVGARAMIPWKRSSYEVNATVAPADAPFARGLDACSGEVPPTADASGCFPSYHWYKGSQGFLHTANSNCEISTAAAQTTIEADPGSPLARMLGAPRVDAPGMWVRIEEGTGLTDLATRYASGEAAPPACMPLP